ncbi:hypothetical protein GCM10011405_23030 [Rufibacter glacialis]|nr:hypothetical protein GCM10011405_23030 [Rufibacter glacialis]
MLALGVVLGVLFVWWKGGISFNLRLHAMQFIVPFLLLLAYSFFYALVRYAFNQKLRQVETSSQHTQAELDALKAQLNPHFFFNTLNNLYGTALQEKAEKTAQSVAQLSGIMRYVLTEAQQNFTDVSHELRFLEEYLQLQRIRLPDRANMSLQTDIMYDGQPASIAPLLLIPFVENAFKYGISLEQNCFVRLRAEVKGRKLDLLVENQLLPERQTDHGAGIAHVRKRLELLYPRRHQLQISQNGTFTVSLHLDLS